jgi:hypothetical protein
VNINDKEDLDLDRHMDRRVNFTKIPEHIKTHDSRPKQLPEMQERKIVSIEFLVESDQTRKQFNY